MTTWNKDHFGGLGALGLADIVRQHLGNPDAQFLWSAKDRNYHAQCFRVDWPQLFFPYSRHIAFYVYEPRATTTATLRIPTDEVDAAIRKHLPDWDVRQPKESP